MGLDMSLYKKHYVQIEERPALEITGVKNHIDTSKVMFILEDFGYWRKANAIHSWFVTNVQDGDDNCGTYYVSREQLAELLATVNDVLADHSKAPELLPTQSGFFFGSTDYDNFYFSDLEDTKNILTEALKDTEADYEYQSSW